MQHIKSILKNIHGFSLIETLVSLSIISGIIFALISFINIIVSTNLRYFSYTKSYDSANLIISLISNDLKSASSIGECGKGVLTVCNFRYKQSDLIWELIPNDKYAGKFTIQKRILTQNGSTVLFKSNSDIMISNQDIFSYIEYQRYNSSLKDLAISVKIKIDSINYTNNTQRVLERTSQVLMKNYDQSQ